MKSYASYVLRRFGQFVLVVFIGINIAFFVTHATPIDPVEQAIAMLSSTGHSSPEAIEMTRTAVWAVREHEDGKLLTNWVERVSWEVYQRLTTA